MKGKKKGAGDTIHFTFPFFFSFEGDWNGFAVQMHQFAISEADPRRPRRRKESKCAEGGVRMWFRCFRVPFACIACSEYLFQ